MTDSELRDAAARAAMAAMGVSPQADPFVTHEEALAEAGGAGHHGWLGGGESTVPHGCFAIVPSDTAGGSRLVIVNRFYRRGHVLYELGSTSPSVDGLVSPGKPLLALVSDMDVGDPEVVLKGYASYGALVGESRDESKAITPLYLCRFSEDGKYAGIEIDFRDMPVFDASES